MRTQTVQFAVGFVVVALLALFFLRRRSKRPAAAQGSDVDLMRDPALAAAALAPGAQVFGGYLLLERIGEGGMAEIFTAARVGASGSPSRVVVKRLRPHVAADPVALAQFEEEVAISGALDHPGVVRVLDAGVVDGAPFLAAEYVVGRDVGRITRRMVERKEPPLSAAAIAYLAHQALDALEHVHGRHDESGRPLDIVHRDVTPENLVVTAEGEVKLLDFGIAKRRRGAQAQSDVGAVKGNVDFMAPEQAQGGPVDPRADVFSLGMVMYFCAARAPLYRGKTFEDRLVKAAMGPGPRELSFVDGLPDPLPEIVARAIASDPAARVSSAAALRAVLAPHIEGGAAELAGVMRRLFADELTAEQARFAVAHARPDRRAQPGGTGAGAPTREKHEAKGKKKGRRAHRRRRGDGVPARA